MTVKKHNTTITIPVHQTWCVYLHRTPETIFYVGRGSHTRPFDARGRNCQWRAFVKPLESYAVEIVLWTPSEIVASIEEFRLVDLWRPCCNLAMPTIPRELLDQLSLFTSAQDMIKNQRKYNRKLRKTLDVKTWQEYVAKTYQATQAAYQHQ